MSEDGPGWTADRRRRGPRPRLTLHHLGFDEEALRDLGKRLATLAAELPVDLKLHADAGDLVLIDEHLLRDLPPRLLIAICDGRPWLEVPRDPPVAGRARGSIAAQRLRRMLLDQIDTLLRSGRGAGAVPEAVGTEDVTPANDVDIEIDSRWPASGLLVDLALEEERLRLIADIRQARRYAKSTRLHATYGPEASIVLDFSRNIALLDTGALQYVRSQRELPVPVSAGELREDATERDLAWTLWDIGVAAGPFPLIDAPADWRRTPLVANGLSHIGRYTKMPLHLDMARRLSDARLTPVQLHRMFRHSGRELRGFLQACLLMGLLRWGTKPLDALIGNLPPPEA